MVPLEGDGGPDSEVAISIILRLRAVMLGAEGRLGVDGWELVVERGGHLNGRVGVYERKRVGGLR